MSVNLSGRHVDVTPALRRYTERKLSRILRRFDRVIALYRVLTVDKLRHRAESTSSVGGPDIHAVVAQQHGLTPTW
jgi:putative sigma-54 modulation protein